MTTETTKQEMPEHASPPELDRELAQRIAFYCHMTALCRRAIEQTKGRRPYVLVEVRGERAGGWVEVYPGVKGQPVAFGRRLTAAGEVHLTRVKVCARTLLAAMQRGIDALPEAARAQVKAPEPTAASGV